MGTLTTTRTPASLMPSRNQVKLDPAELSFTRASQASLDRWKLDLTSLLRDASKRFADVAWTLHTGDEELICAHKGTPNPPFTCPY
jgi:hypothetical protein